VKVLKKILAIILIITFIHIFPIITNISKVEAADVVKLSLQPQPYIDVVLSKANTSTNLTNFKNDLLNSLKAQGVDITKVNISSIDSFEIAVTQQFAWQKYTHVGPDDTSYNSVKGDHITINNANKSILFQGYGRKGYKDFLLYADTTSKPKTIEFTVNTSTAYWHTLEAAGFLVNSEIKNGILSGYAVMLRNGYISIYKFNDQVNAKAFSDNESGSITKYAQIIHNYAITNALGVHNFKLIVEKKNIVVYDNGTKVIDLPIEEISNTSYGFGPIASYNSHACSELSKIQFTNVHMSIENVKYFEEVLREPDWREEAIKVLVNVSDVANEQLNNPNSLGELLSRMINDEIHYVGWGKTINQTQTQQFIAANNNNGIFINNTSYSNSINKTAEYIKSLIESKQSSQYVILNENTVVSSTDSSIMNNTAYGAYPYGRWKIVHDCEYYENNIGQFAQSGKYISNMITTFDKTGKYEIFYEDRNVQPTFIYVHRRPVAEIEINRNGNTITLTSLGYDLDNYSNNKGIKEEEWKYRKVGETTWTNGKLTNISNGTDYLVQLRVKDFQDTWSTPVSKYITKSSTTLPIASFKIKNVNTSIYENLEIVDGSYDPYGGTITNKKWTVYKGTTKIYENNTPLVNYRNYGTGNYSMSLVVTNNRGMVSEQFTRNFKIIPDDEAPEFTATPISCDWRKSVNVTIVFKDRLGSGFKSYQYAITTSQSEPTSWSTARTNAVDTITINQNGIQYLHIKATDNAGNVSESRMVGPYKIDGVAPTAILSHEPTDWSIDFVTINWRFSDSQSGINYIELPDGTTTTNIGGTYIVNQNGSYTFKAYDKVGNVKIVTQNITNIDNVKPEGVLSLSETELTDQTIQIIWEAYDNQSGFEKVLLPDATISKESIGTYPISQTGIYTFIIYDKVGNDREISIEINNIDRIPPVININQRVTRWTNEDITLDWKAYDNQSGLKEVVLPNSIREEKNQGEHIVTQNGIYTFLAYDKIGNGTIVKHEVSNIDKTNPFLKLKKQEGNNGEIEIVWEMSDTQSGIRNLILPDGKSTSKSTGDFIVQQNGIYTFIAYDNVGNDTVISLEVNTIDKQGILFELWEEKTNEEYIKIGWRIKDGQDDFMHILLPDNTYSEELEGYFIVREKGIYTFLAYDKSGNETKNSIKIN